MLVESVGAIEVLRFASMPAGVEVVVSTRRGGVSGGAFSSLNQGLTVNDEDTDVLENRKRFFAAAKLPLERSVWCRQIHRDRVVRVGEGDAGRGALTLDGAVVDVDALITDAPCVPLCVTLADCVPVVLYDAQRHALGLAHAGWGGTVSRIASATIQAMSAAFGTRPEDLVAAIGPSIGPDDYEVGADVLGRLEQSYPGDAERLARPRADGKALLDLWESNRLDLVQAGVRPERIESARMSTTADLARFFSHRMEGRTGRFIAAAMLERP